MLKPFLLVFDLAGGPRQAILDYLDTRPEIKNWLAILPTAIFLISDRDSFQIANLFRQNFPGRLFFITEVPPGANDGWLYPQNWDFINNPKPSGRWP